MVASATASTARYRSERIAGSARLEDGARAEVLADSRPGTALRCSRAASGTNVRRNSAASRPLSTRARELVSANASFEINARIKLDSGDAVRRPVFDAFRFSVEIDAQNRPYTYFHQANAAWIGIRVEL